MNQASSRSLPVLFAVMTFIAATSVNPIGASAQTRRSTYYPQPAIETPSRSDVHPPAELESVPANATSRLGTTAVAEAPVVIDGAAGHGGEIVVPAGPVGLEECIRIGLENQPSVRAAHASLAAAVISAEAIDKLALLSLFRRDIPYRRQQAHLGVDVARGGVVQAEAETIYAITRNYFSVIYARKQLALLDRVLKNLRTVRTQTKTRVDVGDVNFTIIDVYTLDVAIGMQEVRQIEAKQGIERALAALREAMGVPRNTPIKIKGDLPPLEKNLSEEALIDLALANRGEMVQANAGAEILRLEICAQQALPGLTAQTFAAGADIHARSVPQGIANRVYRPGAIDIQMPTMFAGHRHLRVQRARELYQRGIAVADKTRNLITLEVQDSYRKWRRTYEQARKLAEIREKAREVFEKNKARYDLGKLGVDVLLRAQGAYDQVQADYNEALYEHALAIAALERITAGAWTPSFRRKTP